MTGAKYVYYDLEWILHALELDEKHDRVYVAAKGLYAVEEYLQARYYMFRQVYFHRTLRSAEAILQSLLRRAILVLGDCRLGFVIPDSVMEKVLGGAELSTREYLRFDDHDVMFHIKQWTRESDAVLGDLARRFIERRLFKAIDLDMPEAERAAFVAEARRRIEAHGFDPEYYVIEDRAADIPYYGYYRPEGKARLYIERSTTSHEICDIAEVSPVVRGMQGYEIHRLCFPAELGSVVEAIR
jgi:HD superfamily phosphohydrolase